VTCPAGPTLYSPTRNSRSRVRNPAGWTGAPLSTGGGALADGTGWLAAKGAAAGCPSVFVEPRPVTTTVVRARHATTPPATAVIARRARIFPAWAMMSSVVVCGAGAASCTDSNTSRM
jgi:hypothetical protein